MSADTKLTRSLFVIDQRSKIVIFKFIRKIVPEFSYRRPSLGLYRLLIIGAYVRTLHWLPDSANLLVELEILQLPVLSRIIPITAQRRVPILVVLPECRF